MNAEHITRLLEHVTTLTSAGGDYNRLTITAGEYHVIIFGARGRERVTVEVVGNRDLSRGARLTAGRAAVIEEHGYRSSSRKPGPTRTISLEEKGARAALGTEIADIFTRAFGVGAGDSVEFAVSLGESEKTRNVDLVRAMRRMSQKRDTESRIHLYRELAKATYLLPLAREDAGRTAEDDEPHVFEMMGHHQVLGVFTDWNSLRLWKPRGWPYVQKPAHAVFDMASERRVATLLINFRGNVGGQLYLHEVDTIDAAIKRLRRR